MAARNLKSVSLNLMGMEERAVPAALANGVLAIKGTAGNDAVDVRHVLVDRVNHIQVTQNGESSYFRSGAVHVIQFKGHQGDDTFEYFGSKDVVADGGRGDDYLHTGGGNDRLNGSAGDDTILSHAGNDVVRGGSGNDWIEAGDGNDRLFGGHGRDVLVAGDGNDRVDGGKGLDVAFGDYGVDTFFNLTRDAGELATPANTPEGTAYFDGIQDLNV